MEKLDHAAISGELSKIGGDFAQSSSIEVFPELSSTNAWLLQRARAFETDGPLENGAAYLAEAQSAGRGRRGRTWVSPSGGGVYLSLFWAFDLPARALSGLGLMAAVVAAEALRAAGVAALQVKWPNDLVVNELKLGGILIELTQISGKKQGAILGLGVNREAPESVLQDANGSAQPWTGWEAWSDPARPISRSALIAQLIVRLRTACAEYAQQGLAPWVSRWEALHRDQGQTVHVELESGGFDGVALGLDPSGGLRIQVEGAERIVYSGDVTRLRPLELGR
jgi:BirA family biotin operon repressor/biotin-[acetyl-CoA-carboxylase] ligase